MLYGMLNKDEENDGASKKLLKNEEKLEAQEHLSGPMLKEENNYPGFELHPN